MDRRSFIKQFAWCALVLANCGRPTESAASQMSVARTRGGTDGCPIAISLPPEVADPGGDPNRLRIQYRCRIAPDKRTGAHPLASVFLTAIAAGRQIPYCVNMGRVMDVTRLVPEKQGDIYQYAFEVDVAQAVGFSGKGLTFYVHASWRQYRSEAVVMHLDA